MISTHIMSQLATELDRADPSGPANRSVGVNRCRQLQCLTGMRVAAPTLLIPVIGSKRVSVAQQHYHAPPGAYLSLPAGTQFDVDNVPDARQQRYLGAALVFDAETLALFRTLYGAEMSRWRMTPQWKSTATDELYASIAQWVAHERQFSADVTQTRHRLAEILLLLARQGLAGNLLFAQHSSLRDRIKHLFLLGPAQDWRMADLTTRLGMSESTLRRQLRGENTSFRALLEEARLDRGVELVLMTDMPIGQIAFDCGYQSQSRFSERFRLRFSLSPSELRATQTLPAGDVIALDRHRASS